MEQLIGFAIFVGIAVVVGIFFAEIFLEFREFLGFMGPFSFGTAKKNSKEEHFETLKHTPSTGVVVRSIIPPGYGQVKYSGSFWRAVADEPIVENTVVQIVEHKDLTIHVRPLDDAGEEA